VPTHQQLVQRRMYVKTAAAALGRPLPEGAVVHHVDEDRANGRNNNLVILQSRVEHMQLHKRLRTLRAGGNPWMQQICGVCKQVKDFTEFSPSKKLLSGRTTKCKPCTVLSVYKYTGRVHETPGQRSARNSVMATRRWEAYRANLPARLSAV
jgi:hypothetical protein